MKKLSLLIVFSILAFFDVNAQKSVQEQLDSLLGEQQELPTLKTFYSSRIVNAHTTESIEKKTLDFRINHRFGELTDAYNFFGLDGASMRMSFDYGVTDDLTLGIGRSTYNKTIDGFIKYRLLRQTQQNTIPLSLVYVAGFSANGIRWSDPDRSNKFHHRLSYLHQIAVAKKFNEGFSLQLMPTISHRNLIDSAQYQNTVWAMGIGIRQKIAPAVTINVEYFYVGPNQLPSEIKHPLSIGFDIHTGWHTFQLHVTNATATFEQALLTQTTGRWFYTKSGGGLASQMRFGFNISREFHLGEY